MEWKDLHPIEKKIINSIAEDSQLSKEEVMQGFEWLIKKVLTKFQDYNMDQYVKKTYEEFCKEKGYPSGFQNWSIVKEAIEYTIKQENKTSLTK